MTRRQDHIGQTFGAFFVLAREVRGVTVLHRLRCAACAAIRTVSHVDTKRWARPCRDCRAVRA